MNRIHRIIILLCTIIHFLSHTFIDLTQFGLEQYQDIIINNQIIKPASNNHKHCDARYAIIQTVLDKYQRSFTMLDIGASQGYYSFRSAWDYKDSTFVMIEGNNPAYPKTGTQLQQLCEANNQLSNIIFLNRMIIIDDIRKLSECEHFDVILALNILHWFKNDWDRLLEHMLQLGDHIIIETPPQEQNNPPQENKLRQTIIDYIMQKGATIIGSAPRHTSTQASSNFYLLTGNKKFLKKRHWLETRTNKDTHYVKSSFSKKKLIKQPDYPPNTLLTSIWHPGINLVTFKMYNGTYPTPQIIKKSLLSLKNIPSNDWMPNNMVLQGETIVMIDCDDPNHNPGGLGGGRKYSDLLYNRTLEWISIFDPLDIEKHFWNKIVKLEI